MSSFSTSSAKFNKFEDRNVILIQIKVFGKNIKETTLNFLGRNILVLASQGDNYKQ